jgi:hypothetical protein
VVRANGRILSQARAAKRGLAGAFTHHDAADSDDDRVYEIRIVTQEAETNRRAGVFEHDSPVGGFAVHVAHTVTNLRADALRAAPTATLDGLLRSVPGFSLFRRSDSLTANPTAQGVSLRGLGPSGVAVRLTGHRVRMRRGPMIGLMMGRR